MANLDQLKILRQGVSAWNDWRKSNPKIRPNLSRAVVKNLNLDGMDFSKTILDDADFLEAELNEANLDCCQSVGANFSSTKMSGASFVSANLSGADFSFAVLENANFRDAELDTARFWSSKLENANFKDAAMAATILVNVDLSKTKGLDSVYHWMPSSLGIDTLYASEGKIPDEFLHGAGVPKEIIEYLLPSIRTGPAIQWHSCFISYSTKNQGFAERLHSRMRQAGLRVWFDREDMKGGDYLHTQIDRAIQLHDRLLLVLSEESIQSKWVEREIRRTRKIERVEKRRKLFPIRLVDMKTLREWECLDSDTGEDLAEEVRKYHIPDFSNWKNHDAFETAFARLEKDLRTSIGR